MCEPQQQDNEPDEELTMKTRTLVAAFLCILAGTATLRAQTPAFETFTLPGGKMEIKLPGTPIEMKQTQKSPFGDMEVRVNMVTDEARGIVYGVVTCEVPPALRRQLGDGDTAQDGFAGGFVSGTGGKLVSKKKLLVGGSPGVEPKATVFDDNGELQGQLCVIDGTMYMVIVMAPKDGINAKDANRFFNSFQKSTGLR
jgi:hypothetical protein